MSDQQDVQDQGQQQDQGAAPEKTAQQAATVFDLGDDDPAPKGGADKGAAGGQEGDKAQPDTSWRSFINAEKDPELAKFANRYQSVESLVKAAFNARKMISTGELKRALPEGATPEQVAAWRKEQGLPEKPDGYEPAKIAGHEFGDADKPALDAFRSVAHEANMSPKQFEAATAWYAKAQLAAAEARAETDKTIRAETEETLRAEWGPEFRPTMEMTNRFLDMQLGEVKGAFLQARMPDGTMLGSNPAVVKMLAQLAREADGGVGLMRGDGASAKSDDARLAEIQAWRTGSIEDQRKATSPAVMAEEREIIERQLKRQSKAA